MTLHHFSDRAGIEEFVPRSPIRHPEAEPLVYAIDERHSPLYLFPREMPRLGLWTTRTTSADDQDLFRSFGGTADGILLAIDAAHVDEWRGASIVRYDFAPGGFVDTGDHGVAVSRSVERPIAESIVTDLPAAVRASGTILRIEPDLAEFADRFFDRAAGTWRTTLHVSMIRFRFLPGWEGTLGTPVAHP